MNRIEAKYFEASAWDAITCTLCPHLCTIAPQSRGKCGYRINRNGVLYSEIYGRVSVTEVVGNDDLPLFEYIPRLRWHRLGLKGCTMHCPFCNTWKLSQMPSAAPELIMPEQVVANALALGLDGISFGITEPSVGFEYLLDVFVEAKRNNLRTHMATNGLWTAAPLREILPFVDAITVGLKSFDQEKSAAILGADFDSLRQAIRIINSFNTHIEFSWLCIDGLSGERAELDALSTFLAELNSTAPIIVLPYQPDFQWRGTSEPSTLAFLEQQLEALSGYEGNVYINHPDSHDLNTRCKKCQRTLIRRGAAAQVLAIDKNGQLNRECPGCSAALPYRLPS